MNLGSLFFVLVAAIGAFQPPVLSTSQARADTIVQDLRQLPALYDLGHGASRTGLVAKVDIRTAVPALVTAFKDPDASVRSWSIQALTGAERIPVASVPALGEMLKDLDSDVQLSACARWVSLVLQRRR